MVQSEFLVPIKIEIAAKGGPLAWTHAEQLVFLPPLRSGENVTIRRAPIVFIGYGIDAPEKQWDDFKGVDLAGKVVIVLTGDPDIATGRNDFGNHGASRFAMVKGSSLAKRGALAYLFVHDPARLGYAWATTANSAVQKRFDIVRPETNDLKGKVSGFVQRTAVVELFKASGLDFDQAEKVAATPDFKPVVLDKASFSTNFKVKLDHSMSHNVVGRLTGAARPNEAVIFAAHWDHEGVGKPDATGDTIYHGAFDNASGVSSLIEIGRSLAQKPRAARSLVFIAFTLEEEGLLGSQYYALHPLYPVATTVADVVMDGMSPWGSAHDFGVGGYGDTTLSDELAEVGGRQGRVLAPDYHPEQGFRYRSDMYSLAKVGVPSIFFNPGTDLLEGGRTVGDKQLADFLRYHYHQQSDRYDPNWRFDGMALDVALLADLGYRLANSDEWPGWKAGSEFKAVRDATAAERR